MDQSLLDPSFPQALNDLDVGYRVIGLGDVQEGSEHATITAPGQLLPTRLVVFLGAAEQEDEIIAGPVGTESCLGIRQVY